MKYESNTWYKVICNACHKGAGTNYNQIIFYYTFSICKVIKLYQNTPGVPHNKIPEITELTKEQSSQLENYIEEELDIKNPKYIAKRTGIRIQMGEFLIK